MFSLDKGKKLRNNRKLSIKIIASGTGGMADALDSGSSAARLPGSSPGFRILILDFRLPIAQRKACGMATLREAAPTLRASPRTPSPSPDGEAAPTETLARTGILLARASVCDTLRERRERLLD